MAIVVIHGIGEQKHYESLDGFMQGMAEAYKNLRGDFKLNHDLVWFGEFGESCISLIPAVQKNYSQIDFLEYYWSHMTQRKITAAEVTDWIFKVANGAKAHYKKHPLKQDTNYSINETVFSDQEFGYLKYLIQLCSLGGYIRYIYKLSAPFLKLAEIFPQSRPLKKIFEILSTIIKKTTSSAMVDFIGDITLYCTTDDKSEYHNAREQILNTAVEKIRLLALKDDYDEILICGHSLGSVIAYDVIDRLEILMQHDDKLRDKKILRKFKGMVTFGSPLDKVAFFFDEHIDENKQPYRHDIVTHLHGSRRKHYADSNTHIKSTIERYLSDPKKEEDRIAWLNFWMPNDIISGHLDVYDNVKNLNMSDKDEITAFLKKSDVSKLETLKEKKQSSAEQHPSLFKQLLIRLKINKFITSHNEYWKSSDMHHCIVSRFITE